MLSPASPTPLLLRWQGLLAGSPAGSITQHLPLISGLVLCALLAGLPLVTRAGLSLLIAACGLLWVLWALRTSPGQIGPINLALLAVLAVALLATGFSPVPVAAAKGLMKLTSYLGVYALMRQLLASSPLWWDRLVAALLVGQLFTSVIGIRQLYAEPSQLARWSDNNSVAEGTVRIYSTLDNPNLLGGYLLPILPLAAVAVLRWRTLPRRLFALLSLVLGIVALVLTYSRGAWMGMVASLGLLGLLLAMRQTRHWPLFWRRTLPLLLLVAAAVALVVLVTQVEPLRVRVGPGNTAFNLIYPLYQQPKFNALSAYSIPLELLVEAGVPGLLAGLALLFTAMRTGLLQGQGQGMLSLPSLAAVAAFAGLAVQGLTDTIFFRPEVQLVALFSLATLAAAARGDAGTAAAASPLAEARPQAKARSGAGPGA